MFENLSVRLKTERIKNNLSREQLADLIGVSKSTIGFYETGDRQPSLSVLVKLASIYKVSIDYLLDTETVSNYETISLSGLTPDQKQCIKTIVKDLKQGTF